MFHQDNINGVKIALGTNEENIHTVFASSLVSVIETSLSRYENVKVSAVDFNTSDAKSEDDHDVSEVNNNINDNQEFFDNSNNELFDKGLMLDAIQQHRALNIEVIDKIDDYIFNIEAERGTVESIIVNNENLLSEIIDTIDSEFNELLKFKHHENFDVVLREDLDRNFIIRYVNAENQITEMKEIVD